jgi:hypothetical protein
MAAGGAFGRAWASLPPDAVCRRRPLPERRPPGDLRLVPIPLYPFYVAAGLYLETMIRRVSASSRPRLSAEAPGRSPRSDPVGQSRAVARLFRR